MSTVITGLFETPADAAAAAYTLEAKGIRADRMSIVAADSTDAESFAIDSHSKLPEGVAIGAGAGGAIGALVAGFTAVGAVATGGAGLLVAGPVVAALAGAGAGAAGGAGLGAIVGVMIPEYEIKHYESALERGMVMLGVECEDRDEKKLARETFEHFDASKVSSA